MKLLFFPMDGHGHVNSCLGLARMLRDFGHESVFAVPKNWSVLITGHKFPLEFIADPENANSSQDPLYRWAEVVRACAPSFAKTPSEQIVDLYANDTKEFVDYVKRIDDQVTSVIEKVDPDLIVIDFYVTVPAVIKSGKPWLLLYSANPLFAYDAPNTPPRYSGLGATDDPKLFQEFRALVKREIVELKTDFDAYLKTKGVEPHPIDLVAISPYLNLYSYPEDLDYTELPKPEKWFRVDHMVREAEEDATDFDESFFKTDDKVILFSLGSMGSADVTLMKKLLAIMSASKHRFIVSKGPYHNEIQLYDNMIGGKYLPQIKILPKVDLVITHGGNNTFIESLYFGKPCIVLPLFGDQHDNARRAVDKKIGKAFSPYHVTDKELLGGIDDILNDKEMIQRVQDIGEKIRSTKTHAKLSEHLVKMVQELKAN
ncbi:uncharacterized UDP-glucosyltransferase YojK-like isoform X1 [Tetranychus urticae]|uniref:UDP-glycosyltransferase 203F1 n=2 Tax=Tetranychus urticae TaxID=32264 RepID=T1L3L8_TETUR|nr:uncharacterized UDP-glucosyltransferase YojK-like [Tetranychus urticae]XP_015793434.1 uncharacterized UDP-glucosyltransferase YojK-like isoform X1 [Tetranychus urticae]AHX56900.1 UDP-glycosyltransferase 203F1 [Tetranychus urticae]